MGYFLGIDWGRSKVGLAIADDETGLAFGLETVRNDDGLMDRLGEVIKGRDVRTIVIGIPSRVNRKETEYDGERLGRALARHFGVEVFYQDEMYTTKMARELLKERGVRGLDRHDDREAARIILQEWLDGRASSRVR